MRLGGVFGRTIPAEARLDIGSTQVTVRVRVNARARAYRLSVSARGEPVLTVPKAGRWREAEAFLERNRGWLASRLDRVASAYQLADRGIIPLRGRDYRLVSLDKARGLVTLIEGSDGPELHVPGGPEHLRRRLLDWLKAEARRDIEIACARHADTLGVKIAAIRLRDQSTRWGSCSSTRTLNFNWRLVLAPPFVLDYVAAHEVAHILEMNHKPVFWRTLARALPDYERGKIWLKTNGAKLMAI